MTDFIAGEKGVPIRYPSTANLMLDSADRSYNTNPYNFFIQRPNSILNGFFTRVGTTEVVLEWAEKNVSEALGNNSITLTDNANNTHTLIIDDGYYNITQILDEIVAQANDAGAFGPNYLQVSVSAGGRLGLSTTGLTNFYIEGAPSNIILATQLGFPTGAGSTAVVQEVSSPDLRPFRYIDFVSSQLTYNQELKDGSTNTIVRDVLCRWYFDWDTPPTTDANQQPILMGYTPFSTRRLYNPPKQIKWDASQPIGQLGFELYGYSPTYPTGVRLDTLFPESTSNWLMTLQVSEV